MIIAVESQYTCFDALVTADGNLTHVLDVKGRHMRGKTNADVKAFEIESSHEHLGGILKGIEDFFPNLVTLKWINGNLPTLTADDLEPFPELRVFSAFKNKIVSLDGDLFKHNPKLEHIFFYGNLIEHVGFGLLDNLSNLIEADFSYNPCINVWALSPAEIEELKLELQIKCPPLV